MELVKGGVQVRVTSDLLDMVEATFKSRTLLGAACMCQGGRLTCYSYGNIVCIPEMLLFQLCSHKQLSFQ